MDDHPDRRVFLDKMLSFMEEKGTPITQCPTISKNPLDLFRLYLYTKDRGGYLEVRIYIHMIPMTRPDTPVCLLENGVFLNLKTRIYFDF
jgi:hypothetical protein